MARTLVPQGLYPTIKKCLLVLFILLNLYSFIRYAVLLNLFIYEKNHDKIIKPFQKLTLHFTPNH